MEISRYKFFVSGCKSTVESSCGRRSNAPKLEISVLANVGLTSARERYHIFPSAVRILWASSDPPLFSGLTFTFPKFPNESARTVLMFSDSQVWMAVVPHELLWKVFPKLSCSVRFGCSTFPVFIAAPILKKRSSPRNGSLCAYLLGCMQPLLRSKSVVVRCSESFLYRWIYDE